MSIREIVIEYLSAHGFDGLCRENCGCRIEDLMPGMADECPCQDCEPGHAIASCDVCPAGDNCDYYGEGRGDCIARKESD